MELSVNDIANTVQIIDECARRGAFQGAEMQSIGAVRDKLAAFVDHHRPEEQPDEAPEPPEIPNDED